MTKVTTCDFCGKVLKDEQRIDLCVRKSLGETDLWFVWDVCDRHKREIIETLNGLKERAV